MDLHPIWPVIYARSNSTDRSNSTGWIGSKSIEIKTTKFNQAAILCTGRHTNVIPVNSHPIWPEIYAQSNSTNRLNSTGPIGSKSIEIMTTKFDQACNVISMNLHPNRPASISVNFHPIWPVIYARSNSTDRSNSTGWIGSKSIEIKTTKFNQAAILCTGRHTNVIPVNSHPIWPEIYAQSNSTNRLNSTGPIGSKSIEIMTTKFDQACNVISMNLHPNRPASISVNFHPIWPVIYARSNSTDRSNWE